MTIAHFKYGLLFYFLSKINGQVTSDYQCSSLAYLVFKLVHVIN